MKMMHDDFEAWVRDRCRGCMEQNEIDDICQGGLDFETGEYTFLDSVTQAQWEAWKAAREFNWIPVSSRLPEHRRRVVVRTGNKTGFVGRFSGGRWHYVNGTPVNEMFNVVEWSEIPVHLKFLLS